MALVSLIVKLIFAAGLLLGLGWLVARMQSGRNEKARPHRGKGKDRRQAQRPVHRDRRKGPRRTEEVADGFLKDLGGD